MESRLTSAVADRFDVEPSSLILQSWREGRMVWKAATPSGVLAIKASELAGAFDEEAAAMRRLRELDLPVSEIHLLDSGPPSVIASTWFEGMPISAATDPVALRKVGAMLACIHRQPVDPPYSGHASVADWITSWFGSLLGWWSERAGNDAHHAARWLDEVRPLLDRRPGGLMLFDGRPDHFLVDVSGAVRMIDVADLQPGDSSMDLAVLELDAPGILGPVLEGYGATPADSEVLKRLVPFYVLLRALSAAEWNDRVLGDEAGAKMNLAAAERGLTAHLS